MAVFSEEQKRTDQTGPQPQTFPSKTQFEIDQENAYKKQQEDQKKALDEWERKKAQEESDRINERAKLGRNRKIGKIMIVFAIVFIVAAVPLTFLIVNVPATIQYNNAFGSNVELAYSAGSLQSTQTYVNLIYNQMLITFPNTASYSTTYNSWFYWDHIPSNTMAYEQQYLIAINQTINNNIKQAALLTNTTSISQITPYILLGQVRTEMQSNGGIDWVINGSWYLQYAPLAYWSWLIYTMIGITAAILLAVGIIKILRNNPDGVSIY